MYIIGFSCDICRYNVIIISTLQLSSLDTEGLLSFLMFSRYKLGLRSHLMHAEPQEFFCISSRLTEDSAHLRKTPARHKINIQISHKISKDNQPEVLKRTWYYQYLEATEGASCRASQMTSHHKQVSKT